MEILNTKGYTISLKLWIAYDVNPFMHFVCCLVVVVTNRVISHRKYQVRVLPMLDGTSSVLSNGSASCHMSTPATYTMCVWTVHTVGKQRLSWHSFQDRLENGTQDVERRTRVIHVGMIDMIVYQYCSPAWDVTSMSSVHYADLESLSINLERCWF